MKKNWLFLFITDVILLSASFYAAYLSAYSLKSYPINSFSPLYVFELHTGAYVFSLVSFLFSFYLMGLQDPGQFREKIFRNVLFSVVLGTVIVSLLYFFLPHWRQGRTVLLINSCFAFMLTLAHRKLYGKVRLMPLRKEPAAIVGHIAASEELIRELMKNKHYHNLKMSGIVIESKANPPVGIPKGIQVLGTYEEIEKLIKSHELKTLIVSRKTLLSQENLRTLLELKFRGVKIVDAGRLYMRIASKVPIHLIDDEWWLTNEGFTLLHNKIVKHVRRFMDFLLGLFGLIVLSPLFILVSVLVKLTSKGPVFFKQERVGEGDSVFTLVKFRTMIDDAEKESGPVWSQEKDPRVTAFGRFLRRTRLDEIPQFLNVVKGDMSLIGPRPERPEFVKELEREIPYYAFRHMVKPGLTGWAQINYRYGASREDAIEKLQYDLFYIQEMSLWLDAVIFIKTIGTILSKRGS